MPTRNKYLGPKFGGPSKGPKVIVSGHKNARGVAISRIRIPDLWHLARALMGATDKDGRRFGAAERDAVLKTWHIAHQLHRHISGS